MGANNLIPIAKRREWDKLLIRPDWYIQFMRDSQSLINSFPIGEKRRVLVREIYSFFEEKLENGEIVLGTEKGNWDREKKPIDAIVIHHTAAPPGLTPERLSAIELFRLYARYYASPYERRGVSVSNEPISSGHIRNGQQIFWPYHWIVRTDGSVERLLYDKEVGWHAGSWDINCRSVAICLDGNYENFSPPKVMLEASSQIIRLYYPFVLGEAVVGHREVPRTVPGSTTCPGNLFLGPSGWKKLLLILSMARRQGNNRPRKIVLAAVFLFYTKSIFNKLSVLR